MQPGNILKINTLGTNWHDKDTVMLHACFQLLVECIEHEKLFEESDWDMDENTRAARAELEALYQWWRERCSRIEPGDVETSDDAQYVEDTQQMLRLIKLRQWLWT